MKKITISKMSFIAILMMMACSESILNKDNPNGSLPEDYYADKSQLIQGVNAIYAITQGFGLVAREWFFTHDLRSDDCATGGGQLETVRNQILTGVQTPANGVLINVWDGLNRVVHRANSVIDGSVNAKGVSDADLKRLVGEARFLRAWAYSDLTILWGAVPLHQHVATTFVDASQPRTPVADIQAFLIQELTEIQNDLPASYSGNDVGRATKGAAQALLARIFMAKGDYASAKTELLKIVNSGTYQLVDNYRDNFLEETGYNAESIFEIGFAGDQMNWSGPDGDNTGQNGNTRTQEYSAIGWRNLIPSDGLLAEYESTFGGDTKNDPRFTDNFYRLGDLINNGNTVLGSADALVQGNLSNFQGGTEKISWKKYTSTYKNKLTFYTGAMNMRIIRYAEVLANLAECENEVGTGAAALGYLNQIRNRPSVSMPNYPTTKFPCGNKAEIFAAVQHERRVEFAGEQIRNRDILRWRINGKLTSEPISYFQANHQELLPITQDEMTTNAKITDADQNPGY